MSDIKDGAIKDGAKDLKLTATEGFKSAISVIKPAVIGALSGEKVSDIKDGAKDLKQKATELTENTKSAISGMKSKLFDALSAEIGIA